MGKKRDACPLCGKGWDPTPGYIAKHLAQRCRVYDELCRQEIGRYAMTVTTRYFCPCGQALCSITSRHGSIFVVGTPTLIRDEVKEALHNHFQAHLRPRGRRIDLAAHIMDVRFGHEVEV